MCTTLADFGMLNFVLADPKSYGHHSVASQCDPEDVGRFKVHVGAERLAVRGARVTAFPHDISTLPDGLLDSNTILVVSADNRRADILANRLALRHGCPLGEGEHRTPLSFPFRAMLRFSTQRSPMLRMSDV